MAFLLFSYFSFHRLILNSQVFGIIAGCSSFGKKEILITWCVKRATWEQRNLSGSGQRCASVSSSGKRRKNTWTCLLFASIPFVLSLWTHINLFFTCSCLGTTLILSTTTISLWQWLLKVCNPPVCRVSLFDLESIELQISVYVIKVMTCFYYRANTSVNSYPLSDLKSFCTDILSVFVFSVRLWHAAPVLCGSTN